MNKVVLMGRLTRDPEVRYSNAAEPLAIVRYGLAVNRVFRREGEPDADFFNCTAFGKQGEFVEKWFKKGMMVCVSGRIQIRSYDDNTGRKVWATEIITDEHHFGESKASFEARSQGGGGNYPQAPRQPQANQPQQQPQADSFFEADVDLSDNDLPF